MRSNFIIYTENILYHRTPRVSSDFALKIKNMLFYANGGDTPADTGTAIVYIKKSNVFLLKVIDF